MSKKKNRGKTPSKPISPQRYNGTISLVIPCYNEAGRLGHLLKTLKSFDQKWTSPLEIILVDDGSTDDTAKIIEEKFPTNFSGDTSFNFVKLPQNEGKGGALKAGVTVATGDHILTLDADMATRPQELRKWLAKLRDTQCGFKLYPKAAAQKLFGDLKSNGWAHDVELLYRGKLAGYEIQSMPVKWDAMDDSKINLLTDSIKMFWQTVFISLRVNWDFFITQPLKELKNKSWNKKDPSYYRLLFLVTVVILYYGGMFDYFAARLHSWFPSWDVYDLRHLFNSFVGFLLILFTGLLARQVSGSWRAGFFGLIFIVLAPRIFGHAMNNPKDIPFAAAYVFTLLYMLRFMEQLPRPSKKTILLLIVGIASAINVRVGGILLIAYFGLFTILSFLLKNDLRPLLKNTKVVSRTFLTGLFVVIGGYFAGMLYWPYAQEAPLSNPFKALSEMSNFSTSIRMLFNGEHLWSDELKLN